MFRFRLGSSAGVRARAFISSRHTYRIGAQSHNSQLYISEDNDVYSYAHIALDVPINELAVIRIEGHTVGGSNLEISSYGWIDDRTQ